VARLVSTSVAAKELGIGRSTLQRWVAEGRIKPDLVTLGGQYRWDVDRLRAELRERRERDE
jgi:excisionase family DNA binding protein